MTCDLKGGYKLKLRGNHQGSVALENIDTHCQDCVASHTRRLNIHCCEIVRFCVL